MAPWTVIKPLRLIAPLLVIFALNLLGASPLQAAPSLKLKPVKGLSAKKNRQIRALVRRYDKQQRNLMQLPDSAKIIQLREELPKYCRVSDLVAITFSEHGRLSQAAFNQLQEAFNKKLTAKDIERLLRHITAPDPKATWKAGWAAVTISPNLKRGVPALTRLLKSARKPFELVHAAGALAKQKDKIPPEVWRRAAEVLLEALDNPDDTAREAHNYMPRREPWMTRWMIDRFNKAELKSPIWFNLDLLTQNNTKDFHPALRALFLKTLKHPLVQARMQAVIGLREQGLTAADKKIWRKTAKDKDPNVRRMVYGMLNSAKVPWVAPLLVAGLKDPSMDSVVECAHSLMALGHRPAVPGLIAFMRGVLKDPKHAKGNLPGAFQVAAEATVKLAGLKGYDFKRQYDRRGNRHMHATVLVFRDDHYRKEAKRLFTWWDSKGKRMKWR